MELDEHEQGEVVQKWLRQNGSSLVTGIAMGLALVFGWQWWQGRDARQQEEAAILFQSFTSAIEAGDPGKATAFSTQLSSKHGDTPYADLAALRHAAYLQSTGKTAEAIALLRSAAPGVEDEAMAEMIRLRLARLLLVAGKADEARKELGPVDKSRYPAVAAELDGDIAIAQGKREQAAKAYQVALTNLDQAAPTRSLVELKLIDAGGQPPAKPEA